MLPIKSAYNFRDLGGYIGAGGKSVRWRTILRSSDFHELSEEDASYLASIPLCTIVDFRSKDEVKLLPDHPIESVKNAYNFDIDAGNLVPGLTKLIEDRTLSDEAKMEQAMEMMRGMYRRLVKNHTDAYEKLFELLQSGNDTPLLFHCTAGKDRTGMAAALILTSLGVDRDTIYKDYLMTNEALQGKYDHLNHLGIIVTLFKTVYREFLESAFALMEEECGSTEAFLQQKLNVDLQRMQSLYLI